MLNMNEMEFNRKKHDYMGTREKLEKYYDYIKSTILYRQSGDLGLFSRCDLIDCGHVRDNVYCVICLWTASLAFKYTDDMSGKAYELEHSAIKCMRAILFCWMNQISELEDFKQKLTDAHCLSTLFNVHTGIPYQGDYNHLQIDAVSLYILILCQMTVSGCNLIYTKDEASFIQNVLFSIERTYRTTDYGVWEKGSRYSNIRELNSSSIGMAKAALEAANGLNILVSKDIDSYLLSIIGFPAFSIDSLKLRNNILNIIETKLKGSKGYKRYPLDIFGIPSIDSNDKKQKVDLNSLSGQESEWPIFYIYEAISGNLLKRTQKALFSNDEEKFNKLKKIIKGLTTHLSTYGVITQNLSEIEPALVCEPSEIVKIFSLIGKNERLKLSGRPNRPIGLINSCKFESINLLTKLIQISKFWNMYGRPTIFLLLKHEHFADDKFKIMMKFIYDLKSNLINGINIKIDRLQNLLGTACNEYLDFLPKDYNISIHSLTALMEQDSSSQKTLPRLNTKSLSIRSINELPKIQRQKAFDLSKTPDELLKTLGEFDDQKFLMLIENETDYRFKLLALKEFYVRFGSGHILPFFNKPRATVNEEINDCYKSARMANDWSSIRYAASLLEKIIDSLTPSISAILVTGKFLIIGSYENKQYVVTDLLTPLQIYSKIQEFTLNVDPRETCLQQELITYIADMTRANPELFVDISKLNMGWIIQAMKSILSWGTPNKSLSYFNNWSNDPIFNLSPFEIHELLYLTLSGEKTDFLNLTINSLNNYQKKYIDGALCRLPTLHIMTPDELYFPFFIEVILNNAKEPVKRQLCVEMIVVIASLFDRNPEIECCECLNIQELITEAKKIYKNKIYDNTPNLSLDENITDFEYLPSKIKNGTTLYMIQAAIKFLITESSFNETIESDCVIS
ncbi:hypothetical protein HZS_723 [Henneguya salminicola]|nr:hypothetical protein HZS_723 [Henneguya salminicola]